MFKLLFQKDQRGFTLVEVVLASVLLLTVLTVSYGAVNYKSMTNISASTDYATALNDARAVIADASNVLAKENAIDIEKDQTTQEISLYPIMDGTENSSPVVYWSPNGSTLTIKGQAVNSDPVTGFSASSPDNSNPATVVELTVEVTVHGHKAQLSRTVHTLTVGTQRTLSGQSQPITHPWITATLVSSISRSKSSNDSSGGGSNGDNWGNWNWGGWHWIWGWGGSTSTSTSTSSGGSSSGDTDNDQWMSWGTDDSGSNCGDNWWSWGSGDNDGCSQNNDYSNYWNNYWNSDYSSGSDNWWDSDDDDWSTGGSGGSQSKYSYLQVTGDGTYIVFSGLPNTTQQQILGDTTVYIDSKSVGSNYLSASGSYLYVSNLSTILGRASGGTHDLRVVQTISGTPIEAETPFTW